MASDMLSAKDAFSLWDTITGALMHAASEVVWDFTAGDPKPWSYYAGVAGGVLAGNEPGIGAIVYVVGSTLDIIYREGPDASDIKWFVDGVAQTDISAYAAEEAWTNLNIGGLVEGVVHTVELRWKESETDDTTAQVFALGNVTVTGEQPAAAPFQTFFVADVWEINTIIEDAKGKTSKHTYYLPTSYSYDNVVYFAQDYAWRMSQVISGVVKTVNVKRNVTPEDLPTIPQAESDVEEKMVLTYGVDEASQLFRHSVATWRSDLVQPDSSKGVRVPSSDDKNNWLMYLMLGAEMHGYPAPPCDRRGVSLVSWRGMEQIFRRR